MDMLEKSILQLGHLLWGKAHEVSNGRLLRTVTHSASCSLISSRDPNSASGRDAMNSFHN